MPARLTAYLPDAAASCLVRSIAPMTLGRGADCGFRIEHPSVSRAHARLEWTEGHWRLVDLDSKNGLHLDGQRVAAIALGEQAWFRLGDVACEWALLSEAAADQAENRLVAKRANSRVLIEAVERQTSLPGMLQETLRATVELAECERGFILLADRGKLRVAASPGLQRDLLVSREFGGSIGAVERALQSGQSLVVNDIRADASLAARESVIQGGLRTLLCLPLRSGDELLGLIYADGGRPGTVITTTDLALLSAFAERAALWIAARRDLEELARLSSLQADWDDIVQAQRLASA
jgi:hypothetical protein